MIINNKKSKHEELSSEAALSYSSAAQEVSSQEVSSEIKEQELEISSPAKRDITVTENTYTFRGVYDPEAPLILNGEKIEGENGLFSKTVNLVEGGNYFKFEHKGKTYEYVIRYNFKIIKSISPSGSQNYSSGSTITVSAVVHKDSSVTADFNNQTITLKKHIPQNEDEEESETYVTFTGTFKLPSNNTSNINLGKIKFTASVKGKSETKTSGNITCKKAEIKVSYNPLDAPLGGRYINVGTGKIAEIVAYEAETFDAYSTNDWSRPTNNYLPKGTVDYCAQGYAYYESSTTKKQYAILRCGKQVYTSKTTGSNKENMTIVKEYAGTLPDHNEINIAQFKNGTTHTTLVLDSLWKAPFYFDILPQSYSNPSKQDYDISSFTANYIDITLCYTTVLEGEISVPENNPVFKSAKIIKNQSDYTIRLYLKKQGGFYGWDCYYNQSGQLVFEFLNPAKVERAQNKYGATLNGVKILLDVGHGGIDQGASGFDYKNHSEATQNLVLANKIAAQLESIGATVVMTRSSNKEVTSDEKIIMLKQAKPDLCIAVHHNSASRSSANGFDSYYSQPFSMPCAKKIFSHTQQTGLYSKHGLGWHYYGVARSSCCPVVLTENGFISNLADYNNIISSSANDIKATAIVKGVVEYFLENSPKEDYKDTEVNTSSSVSSNTSSTISSNPQSSSSSVGVSSKPELPSTPPSSSQTVTSSSQVDNTVSTSSNETSSKDSSSETTTSENLSSAESSSESVSSEESSSETTTSQETSSEGGTT